MRGLEGELRGGWREKRGRRRWKRADGERGETVWEEREGGKR